MGASLRGAVKSSAPGKAIAASGSFGPGYLSIGTVLGGLSALLTFFVVWVTAADAGVLGILFGWIPAGIAAAVIFWLVAFLWAPLLLIGVLVWSAMSKQQEVAAPVMMPAAASSAAADYSASNLNASAALAAPTPSFNCAEAKGVTAAAICADAELSDLDQKLGAAYTARLALDPSVKERQRAWLAARDVGCGGDRDCLKAFIAARTAALDARGVPSFPTTAVAMPTSQGDCLNTSVASAAVRNPNDPASGAVVTYASGGQQVSAMASNMSFVPIGDPVIVCLVTVPDGCPPDDHRGAVYAGADVVTALAWRALDSDKTCGTP